MSDLDSFFAKKDKKKVKGRKYDNPDEIAKRLEVSEEKLKKEFTRHEPPKKQLIDESSTNSNLTMSVSEPAPEKNLKQEEEEWKEYNEEADDDMTDLKITKLQIEDDDETGGGYGSGDDGEGGVRGSGKSEGVWNRTVDRVSADEVEEVAPPPSKEENRSSGPPSSYVPPHLRGSNAQSSQQPKGSRKPKTAPDITNAMAFPSLSDAQSTTLASPWGRKKIGDDKGFENVKHGSTKTYSDDYAPSKLSTSNRFDALSDNS